MQHSSTNIGVTVDPYYRARYYEPTVGRFLSEDPLGFGGGNDDFYAYALNNPAVIIDPSGMAGAQGAAATAAAAASAAKPALQLIQGGLAGSGGAAAGGAGAGIVAATVGLAALDVGLAVYDGVQFYKLGQAYGWWGSFRSQKSLNAEGNKKAQEACERNKGGGGDDDCSKEWQDAYRRCSQYMSEPGWPDRLVGTKNGVRYNNLQDCARGFVSQRCGGNRVQ